MSSHAEYSTLRWDCATPDHEHQSWEEADCCDCLLTLLAQLQCASGDSALGYALPVITLDHVVTALMVNPDEAYSQIYAQLRALYESAGQPEGTDDAGLWRWIGKICM
ncbi:MAG TPA: hypothetical protein VJ810_10230 [Blastocatellia bacterium]|nr:hypothetical protein [Blastocatellia bacterium]